MKQASSSYSLKNLFIYFFLLGTFGFGGAYTLINVINKDLVNKKRWLTENQFKQGLAFTQFAPGPLVAQLAMYIGFLKSNFVGAFVAGISFFLTPALSILILTIIYKNYGDVSWIKNAFYTVNPAVIGLIISSTISLAFKTINNKSLLFIFLGMFLVSLITWSANYYLFIVAGVLSIILQIKKGSTKIAFNSFAIPFSFPFSLTTFPLSQLFFFFMSAGFLTFGGGYAILPYLQSNVVSQFHWLTNKEFLDGLAIAMITPGPIVLISIFIGYFVAGLPGAFVATLGMFIPAYLVVIIIAPIINKYSHNFFVQHFVDGVVAAAMGAVFWVVISLGLESIKDITTLLFVIGAIIVARVLKLQSTWVVLIAGILGVFFFPTH